MTNVTLVLNDAEQQALHQLLDAALRQSGLNAIDVVSHFMGRIIAAQGAATQAQGASQKPMQAQPAVPLQPAAAVSPVQSHASQSGQAHAVTAPSSSAPVNNTTANHNPEGAAEHESVLSHLIGEITGAARAHPATRSAASAAAPDSVSAPAATVAQAQGLVHGSGFGRHPKLPGGSLRSSCDGSSERTICGREYSGCRVVSGFHYQHKHEAGFDRLFVQFGGPSWHPAISSAASLSP